jgi:WD40 repeat protein
LLEGETVAAIAFSPSGRWMATGTSRGLRLWDTTTWQLIGSHTNAPFDKWPELQTGFAGFNEFSASSLAFSPDERLLIAVTGYALCNLSELSAWKIPSLEHIPFPASSVHDATCVAFAPDGPEFVTRATGMGAFGFGIRPH